MTSLLRGTGGFNHPRESLNPSLHKGGPRRGRSFCRRLCWWCWWHGSRSVEMTSYVVASEYVTARLRRHEGASATLCGFGYGDMSSFGFFTAWNWSLRPTRLTLDPDVPPAASTCAFTCTLLLYFLRPFAPSDCSAWDLCLRLQTLMSGVTSPWHPEASLMSNPPASSFR